MEFTYQKRTPKIVLGDHSPGETHIFSLVGGGLEIEASRDGVRILGMSQYFQPVDEEMKIPDDFREFMVRLSSAFDLAFKEQEKDRKEANARQTILGVR